MRVWSKFAASRRVRVICFALAGALLVTSVLGLTLSAAPIEPVRTVAYEHRGQFDYTVYLKPSLLYGDMVLAVEEAEEGQQQGQGNAPMIFFRDIMKETILTFSYGFDCGESVSSVDNRVVVSIIAENPGVWQKEFKRFEETHTEQEFSFDFPLSLSGLEKLFAEIEEDIGISTVQRDFIVRATVTTTAKTTAGRTITDRFGYELRGTLTARRLELKGDLESTVEGYRDGVRYEGKGRFDYAVHLRPNTLYETDVLRSQPPEAEPSPPAQTLGPGLVYFPRMIHDIEGRFSYQFLCGVPIREQSQEVEVTVTIENPGKWTRTVGLVPGTEKEGSFTISFPIDIRYFTRVIDAIGQETGARGTSHNIKLEASVRTVADTAAGTIDEVYTQTLGGKLEANALTFDKELSRSQPGTIDDGTAGGNPAEEGSRTPWTIMLVIGLVALAYFGWAQTRLGLATVSAGEAEAARVRKKYKQMLVDVDGLPEARPDETVVPLSSIDDLVRIADDLAKPVLHEAVEGRHSYCVIDTGVRYLYVGNT